MASIEVPSLQNVESTPKDWKPVTTGYSHASFSPTTYEKDLPIDEEENDNPPPPPPALQLPPWPFSERSMASILSDDDNNSIARYSTRADSEVASIQFDLRAQSSSSSSRSRSAGLSSSLWSGRDSERRLSPLSVISETSYRAGAKRRRREALSDVTDEESEGVTLNVIRPQLSNKESIRRQRIESEQRRRDLLRECYANLKGALPASNQRTSKISLLERATSRIRELEAKLKLAEDELAQVKVSTPESSRVSELAATDLCRISLLDRV